MDVIGRYSVIRKIGSGGMAEVFLARARGAQGTEKQLVIKKIHPALARSSRFIEMFVDEARVAMRLNHSNIVQVYAFEQLDEGLVLAMEHVDGPNLLELQYAACRAGKRFPWGVSAFVVQEVAKGLDYAHSRRDDRGEPLDIVHRDVSPQNVLITREGAVKITDFGIARARWLHDEKRGLCWRRGEHPLRFESRSAQTRNALIAPLLVEQRVEGALIAESRQADRFDEHHLAVLTTLAQQAAAALESSRTGQRVEL
jgi:serine/threonine protein kinase